MFLDPFGCLCWYQVSCQISDWLKNGVPNISLHPMMISWHRNMSTLLAFVRAIHRSPVNFPHRVASNAALWCFLCFQVNKLLNKQSSCRWFDTSCCSSDVTVMLWWDIISWPRAIPRIIQIIPPGLWMAVADFSAIHPNIWYHLRVHIDTSDTYNTRHVRDNVKSAFHWYTGSFSYEFTETCLIKKCSFELRCCHRWDHLSFKLLILTGRRNHETISYIKLLKISYLMHDYFVKY